MHKSTGFVSSCRAIASTIMAIYQPLDAWIANQSLVGNLRNSAKRVDAIARPKCTHRPHGSSEETRFYLLYDHNF